MIIQAMESISHFHIKSNILLFYCLLNSFCFAAIFINSGGISGTKEVASWVEIKDKNLTRQRYDYSCGSASLSTILKYYYNLEINEVDILDSILASKGVDIHDKEKMQYNMQMREKFELSFLDLSEYAQTKGFKALGLALDLHALSKLKAPVIIYVNVRNNEHFTVYKGMDTNYVYLADPSFGNIKVSRAKFQEMFYQRDDLKYPGKILALVPENGNKRVINHDFMKPSQNTQFIYEIIKERMH